MVLRKIILEIFPSIWPMLLFVSVVAISIRSAVLFKGSRKFVFHKEIMNLIFMLYILCLYHILIYQDNSTVTHYANFTPFSEMFRYTFGSYKFMKNVMGNIVLFIPFGFYVAYYLRKRKFLAPFVISLITSISAEIIQYHIGRVFDIDDILLNVFGAFLGYLIYKFFTRIKGKLPDFMKEDWFLNILIILIVLIVVLFFTGIIPFSG